MILDDDGLVEAINSLLLAPDERPAATYRLLRQAADAIPRLKAERDELAKSRADYVQGCKDLGATAKHNLERALTAERHLAEARDVIRGLLRGEYESAEPGLCDCVDNDGKPYQSQFLADWIAAAEVTLSTGAPDGK